MEMRRQIGAVPSSGDWVAQQVLVAMVVLLVQFGLGMWVNLYARIPSNHPGTNASGYFAGVFHSVTWAILHGQIPLAVHAALGLVLSVGILHGIFWNLKWGNTASISLTVIGAAFVVAAAFNGGAFLTYGKDVYSFLMALFFGAALLMYGFLIRVLMRSPEIGRIPRSQRKKPDPTASIQI
jgi:hypothetical protein